MSNEHGSKVFCNALDEWAALMETRCREYKDSDFPEAWRTVRLAIGKSCLLSRTIYGGEKPSKTPCPVHKGRWSGLHMWGSRLMPDGLYHVVWRGTGPGGEIVAEPEEAMLAEWRVNGCRCAQHTCGCTSGWQPDEHCGCGVKP